jgi:2,3-dihydroxy-p-cumate/2,3-dihydroxybenzoate 3,4-dioxygenase
MIRYKRLGYLALNASDCDRTQAFYVQSLGLQKVSGPAERLRYLRCSDKHHDIVLYPSEQPGLKRIGFEMESAAALQALQVALQAAGREFIAIPPIDAEQSCTVGGIRTTEPATGAILDFYLSMTASNAAPFVATLAKIQRLGHVVLRSPDYVRSVAFFRDVLNFKVSDSIEDAVTFMRCFPNPLHHSLGIGNGQGKSGLHHVNFMVTEVDDIGRAIWRFAESKIPVVNGPGRHLPSGSMFLYFLDPDGVTVEYSFGMEEFPECEARAPRTLPAVRNSFDLWNGPVDPRKSAIGAIEQLIAP